MRNIQNQELELINHMDNLVLDLVEIVGFDFIIRNDLKSILINLIRFYLKLFIYLLS